MKNLFLFTALLILTNFTYSPHQSYVSRFYRLAQQEHRLYGIPASVTLAQGILESGGGTSQNFQKWKNSFGIMCKEEPCHSRYHCIPFNDRGTEMRIRRYNTYWDSFRDHSIFVTSRRYSGIKSKAGGNVYIWCDELQRLGYSVDPRYRDKLLDIIEKENLTRFD